MLSSFLKKNPAGSETREDVEGKHGTAWAAACDEHEVEDHNLTKAPKCSPWSAAKWNPAGPEAHEHVEREDDAAMELKRFSLTKKMAAGRKARRKQKATQAAQKRNMTRMLRINFAVEAQGSGWAEPANKLRDRPVKPLKKIMPETTRMSDKSNSSAKPRPGAS